MGMFEKSRLSTGNCPVDIMVKLVLNFFEPKKNLKIKILFTQLLNSFKKELTQFGEGVGL